MTIDKNDIIKYRESNNLTQQDFADIIGVSKNTVYNYERGDKIPDTKIPILKGIIFGKNQNPNIGTEQKKENKGMFTDEYIRELTSNPLFLEFIDERVNEANKKLQMADYNEEKAKIRREIEKQRQEQQKTKKA